MNYTSYIFEKKKSYFHFRNQQSIIDDQSQKIEYLIKKTSTLKEINDSGIRMYEQLEASISDLESKNKKLMDENHANKSKIETIEKLENRCEQYQKLLEYYRTISEC